MARGGFRPTAGRKPGIKELKPRKRKSSIKESRKSPKRKDEIPKDIQDDAAVANMTPLDYMLMVMRDKMVDASRRDRMAVAAAPFCHPRKGEGSGKKDEKADRAKTAGTGKFASMSHQLKVVK